MTILTTLNLFLELAVQYLRLKIKTSTYDILEKFDARIDKLDERRKKLRAENNSAAQEKADEIFREIEEEKKKRQMFLVEQNLLDKPEKQPDSKA